MRESELRCLRLRKHFSFVRLNEKVREFMLVALGSTFINHFCDAAQRHWVRAEKLTKLNLLFLLKGVPRVFHRGLRSCKPLLAQMFTQYNLQFEKSVFITYENCAHVCARNKWLACPVTPVSSAACRTNHVCSNRTRSHRAVLMRVDRFSDCEQWIYGRFDRTIWIKPVCANNSIESDSLPCQSHFSK